MKICRELGILIVEDNPYGQLWFDQPPPPALSAHWPEGSIYMGSFSQILAPGLRLGYVVAPKAIARTRAAEIRCGFIKCVLVISGARGRRRRVCAR